MVNDEAIRQIQILEQNYELNWGRKVDYTVLPQGLSQEKLVAILERIVNTGESVLEGWNRIFNKR